MDAKPPEKPPEKPPMVKEMDPETKRLLDLMHSTKGEPSATILDYGPIKKFDLGIGWEDVGGGRMNPRHRFHTYRHVKDDCFLRVYTTAINNHDTTAAFVSNLVRITDGPVAKSDFEKVKIFGISGNPRFFDIESIAVVEIGGKKVVTMTGIVKRTGTHEKNVYVSLSGDWKDRYEFGIAGSPDKETFEKQVANFDKALKTIVWRQE